jgi:non-ribosomal peptide synthetase component E (peptide arylation enzyme)
VRTSATRPAGTAAGRVAPWWIPDAIVRLAAMPLAPTGKIDKIRLAIEYGEG